MGRTRSSKILQNAETDSITFYVTKDIKKWLKVRAAEEDKTVTAVLLEMITGEMEEQKDE